MTILGIKLALTKQTSKVELLEDPKRKRLPKLSSLIFLDSIKSIVENEASHFLIPNLSNFII